MDEIDIWRMAQAAIDRYGRNAQSHAAEQADDMIYHGDVGGLSVWLRIGYAIDELQRLAPGVNETVH